MAEPDLAKVQEQLNFARAFLAAPFVVALQGTLDLAAQVMPLSVQLERSQSAHQELKDAYWKETGEKADQIAALKDQLEQQARTIQELHYELDSLQRSLSDALDRLGR